MKIVSINALIIVVVFVLSTIFIIDTYFQDELKDKVLVTYNISNKNNSCKNVNKPIEVSVTNNTDKTITQVKIKMGLYKSGFSKDVSNHKLNKTTSNSIIKPKDTYVYCSQAPIEDYAKEVTKEIFLKKKDNSNIQMGDLIYTSGFSIKTQYKDIKFKE